MKKSDSKKKFELVDLEDPAYEILREVLQAHHTDLAEAEIGLVWMLGVKEDRDRHLVWGRAKKVGPVEREFHDHDFVIMLNALVWRELPGSAKRALMDHELSHCGVKTNDAGETTFYVRKHDLEEFVHIVRRYGLWKDDIEQFVNAALKKEQKGLPFDGADKESTESENAAGVDQR